MVGSHSRSTLCTDLFTICRTWPAPGGQSLQGQQGARCQSMRSICLSPPHLDSCPHLQPVSSSYCVASAPTGLSCLPTSSHCETWNHLSQHHARVYASSLHREDLRQINGCHARRDASKEGTSLTEQVPVPGGSEALYTCSLTQCKDRRGSGAVTIPFHR